MQQKVTESEIRAPRVDIYPYIGSRGGAGNPHLNPLTTGRPLRHISLQLICHKRHPGQTPAQGPAPQPESVEGHRPHRLPHGSPSSGLSALRAENREGPSNPSALRTGRSGPLPQFQLLALDPGEGKLPRTVASEGLHPSPNQNAPHPQNQPPKRIMASPEWGKEGKEAELP